MLYAPLGFSNQLEMNSPHACACLTCPFMHVCVRVGACLCKFVQTVIFIAFIAYVQIFLYVAFFQHLSVLLLRSVIRHFMAHSGTFHPAYPVTQIACLSFNLVNCHDLLPPVALASNFISICFIWRACSSGKTRIKFMWI